MARTKALDQDLCSGMTALGVALERHRMSQYDLYLLVRRRGHPENYILLKHPTDKGDFADKLLALHKAEAEKGS